MFSSLATFLFGAQQPISESTNSEANNPNKNPKTNPEETNGGDVIEVTSSTPSVAGNNRSTVRVGGGHKQRGGKNRRGKQRQNNQQQHQQQQQQGGQRKQTAPTITILLTSGEQVAEDSEEDDWYIVEREVIEEDDSLPRTDSEEELSVVEVQAKPVPLVTSGNQQRRRQQFQSHSLYSGPRPQQQRNYLQHNRGVHRPLTISTSSPIRGVPARGAAGGPADNNGGITQSMLAPSTPPLPAALSPCGSEGSSSMGGGSSHGTSGIMEESWYVTPPPCFTSIGPINMETSPFENLLIEHPSMSVYHSIRSSIQAGTESYVNLDLGAEPSPTPSQSMPDQSPEELTEVELPVAVPPSEAVQERGPHNARFDRQAAAQLRQQALARESQKSKTKKQHQQLGRSAIKRSNKVRDVQGKARRPRRSDMQHCKLISGANNNRKCCF